MVDLPFPHICWKATCCRAPRILELWHYASCPRCRERLRVRDGVCTSNIRGKKVYEVTFKARKNKETRNLSGYVSDDEDEDEEDEDEEFEVKRPRRLSVGERPEASSYV